MAKRRIQRHDESPDRKKTKVKGSQKRMEKMISNLSKNYNMKPEVNNECKPTKGKRSSKRLSKSNKASPVSSPEVFEFDECDEENVNLQLTAKSVSKLKRKIYQSKRSKERRSKCKPVKILGEVKKSLPKDKIKSTKSKTKHELKPMKKISGLLMDDSGVFMTPPSVLESSSGTNSSTSTPQLPNKKITVTTKKSPDESALSVRNRVPSVHLLSPVEMATPIMQAQGLCNASADDSQFLPLDLPPESPEAEKSLVKIPRLTYSRGDSPVPGKLLSMSSYLNNPPKKKEARKKKKRESVSKWDRFAEKMNSEFDEFDNFELSVE